MTGVAFNRHSEATVKLLQAVLKDIHGHNIATDGDFGPRTSEALTDALTNMNLSGGSIDDVETWRRFLRRSARVGFVRSMNA
jgi:peptidoglycan hydrolase-like protein with peptidoglycan-binding domain